MESQDASSAAHLDRLIETGEVRVGVIGLGYVGLPLALAFGRAKLAVLGFDLDPEKVTAISQGRSHIAHPDAHQLAALVSSGLLEATVDLDRLGEPDVLIICVPTPLTQQREPNLGHVMAAARKIRETLRPGQLVVLESTTYPGTTEELREVLELTSLRCGRDFFLGYSPEREDPGNLEFGTTRIPKVVGGVDEMSAELTQKLYDRSFARTIRMSSAHAAEACKLTENIFRAVNIALVNELKIIYEKMGVDIWEVLAAAETKPFGFMRFNPGPGWGGHCIPIDPFYLSWKAREFGADARFIELAGEVNRQMPRYVVQKVQAALNQAGKAVHGSSVLVVGIAYKKDVADPRESPAFEVIKQMLELGARVTYHDPHIPEAPPMRSWPDLPAMRSVELSKAVIAASDAVVIVTDHSAIDFAALAEAAPLIIDTRGVYPGARPNVVKA